VGGACAAGADPVVGVSAISAAVGAAAVAVGWQAETRISPIIIKGKKIDLTLWKNLLLGMVILSFMVFQL
jgi:hypothetical protein